LGIYDFCTSAVGVVASIKGIKWMQGAGVGFEIGCFSSKLIYHKLLQYRRKVLCNSSRRHSQNVLIMGVIAQYVKEIIATKNIGIKNIHLKILFIFIQHFIKCHVIYYDPFSFGEPQQST
jgi:hypothetical protein